MKKILSIMLSSLFVLTLFASCFDLHEASASSSSGYADSVWLEKRLGSIPDGVTVGIGDAVGVDMSRFEDDGYLIRSKDGEVVVCGKTEVGLDMAVRKYAKAYENGQGASLNVVYHEGERIESLTVAGRDIADYRIVMKNNGNEIHTVAASELQKYIEKACGDVLEITDSMGEHNIVIEQITVDDARFAELGDESFVIEVRENGDVYITGGRYRGCLYGVYDFLEEYLGYVFWYDYDLTCAAETNEIGEQPPLYPGYVGAEIEYVPEADHVDIPAGTYHTETPSFEYRRLAHDPSVQFGTNYRYKYRSNRDGLLGEGVGLHANHGVMKYNHLFVDFTGRNDENLCYSNEDNIQITIDYFEEQIRSKMDAGQKVGVDIVDVDVGHADTSVFCKCKTCQALYKKDGLYTGAILNYTNRVAEALAEDISPEIYVNMFAYNGTTMPPKVTMPRENVSVSYCFFPDPDKYPCYAHSIDGKDCEGQDLTNGGGFRIDNPAYAKEFERWCEITSRVFVWYYPGSWYFTPFSQTLYKNTLRDVKYLKECGVYGFYACPSYRTPDDAIIEAILPRLQWNCDITDAELENMVMDYMRFMYGDAAEYIYEWTQMLYSANRGSCWDTSVTYVTERLNFNYFLDNFDKIVGLFDEAISEAGSYLEECRIRQRAAYAYYPCLVTNYTPMYVKGTDEERALYLERWDTFDEAAKFFRISFGSYCCPDKPIFDFDITKKNPIDLSIPPVHPHWFEKWEAENFTE